jgi:hypothetical protein
MLKAGGYFPAEMRLAVLNRGGVLVHFRGRRYHSAYMAAGRFWVGPETNVFAYAIVDDDPEVVYAESVNTKTGKTIFYPWEDGARNTRPCR